MRRAIHVDGSEQTVRDLVAMLHQGASAEEFARHLADVDALPPSYPGKSTLVETVRMAMSVRNRLELQEQRERGLLAVIASAQDLSSRLDLRELLSAIVSRARNLLGSDVAWLSTYDAEIGEFHVLVVDGALSQGPSGMVARRDHGVAGLVMSTRLPFTTPDYLHDKRFAHESKLDDTFREEGIAALVGVPLIWEGEVIGLLFVADRYHRMHTAQSTSILCTLATYAAVALKNARDFERANAAFDHIYAAGHASEIAFFGLGFDQGLFNLPFVPANEKGKEELKRATMAYLSNFARTGNPNSGDPQHMLPAHRTKWEQWSNAPGGPKAIVFDADLNQAKINMMMTDEVTFAIAEAERQAWVAAQAPANRTLADNVTKLFLFQPPW